MPSPDLIRLPGPAPSAITPESVVITPASVCTVPAVLSVMARALVKLAVVPSVPPVKVTPPPGAPRFSSAEIESVPSAIVHGVTVPVVPVSVQLAPPVFSKVVKPRYCDPIVETSKVLLRGPPSASVPVPPRTTALPVMPL